MTDRQTTLDVGNCWRHIGGGIWDGEDVTLSINDTTGEIEMLFWGEWKF